MTIIPRSPKKYNKMIFNSSSHFKAFQIQNPNPKIKNVYNDKNI